MIEVLQINGFRDFGKIMILGDWHPMEWGPKFNLPTAILEVVLLHIQKVILVA